MNEQNKDQIPMEFSGVEEVIPLNLDETEKTLVKRTARGKEPQTISLCSEVFTDDDDEDVLVSPNKDVFNRITKQLETPNVENETVQAYTSAFQRQESQEESLNLDNRYANTQETNRNFMSAFGLSERDKNVTLEGEESQSTAEIETLQGDIHSDYYEYTNRGQRKEIIGMYKYAVKSMRIKMILSAVFLALLFVVESINSFADVNGILNAGKHPYFVFFADFILMIACAVVAYDQIYHGAKSFIEKNILPESVGAFAVAIGLLQSVFALIFIPYTQTLRLYNFPVAFVTTICIVYSYVNVVREKYGFSVVSSKDEKFVLKKPRGVSAETELETFSSFTQDYEGKVTRVEKTSFVKNYFKNTNSTVDMQFFMSSYYKIILAVPFIFFVISLFRHFSFIESVDLLILGVLLCLPVLVLYLYSLPFYLANRRLFDGEVSILGEEAIETYGDSAVVSTGDTTAFPPYHIKLQNMQLYNGFSMEKVLYYAASGFGTVGGPLSSVFETSTKDAFQKSKRTKFVASARSYLCVKVDGDVVIFADQYGMSTQGIDVGTEKEESDYSIMFIALNGKLCAKIYLKYQMDDEFIRIAKLLAKNKIAIGIRTFDPNITNELLFSLTGVKKTYLKAIRLTEEEDIPKKTAKENAQIVSKGLSRNLLCALAMCKKILFVRKIGKIIKIIGSVGGATLLGFMIFGSLPIIPSYLVALFYVAVALPMVALTFLLLPSVK